MIVENPNARRAQGFGAIVDLGLAAWALRWPLYLAIAAASVAIESAAAMLARYDGTTVSIVSCCVDGFATAFVSLDVAARFAAEERTTGSLMRAALTRWPLVSVLLVLLSLVAGFMVYPLLFGSAEQMLYGVFILPALAVLGTLGVVPVVASIDRSMPQFALLAFAFVRTMLAAAGWPNLGRVTVAGAMVAVPVMLEQLLAQWLTSRGFAAGPAFFWANVPIDAVCVAPFQAFFTYLYLDFIVREQRR